MLRTLRMLRTVGLCGESAPVAATCGREAADKAPRKPGYPGGRFYLVSGSTMQRGINNSGFSMLSWSGKLTDQDVDDIVGRMTKIGPDGKPVVQASAATFLRGRQVCCVWCQPQVVRPPGPTPPGFEGSILLNGRRPPRCSFHARVQKKLPMLNIPGPEPATSSPSLGPCPAPDVPMLPAERKPLQLNTVRSRA